MVLGFDLLCSVFVQTFYARFETKLLNETFEITVADFVYRTVRVLSVLHSQLSINQNLEKIIWNENGAIHSLVNKLKYCLY
jgi:hypothetical protein